MSRKHSVFVEGAISPETIARSISSHSIKKQIGAHSIFLGQVRDDLIGGKKVAAIDYSCYREMAEEVFHEIREKAFSTYDLTCMHIYHSLGKVDAGGICLFVFVSSKNRIAAISACNEIVEEIKAKVPIWGKEVFEDETYVWKENRN